MRGVISIRDRRAGRASAVLQTIPGIPKATNQYNGLFSQLVGATSLVDGCSFLGGRGGIGLFTLFLLCLADIKIKSWGVKYISPIKKGQGDFPALPFQVRNQTLPCAFLPTWF